MDERQHGRVAGLGRFLGVNVFLLKSVMRDQVVDVTLLAGTGLRLLLFFDVIHTFPF